MISMVTLYICVAKVTYNKLMEGHRNVWRYDFIYVTSRPTLPIGLYMQLHLFNLFFSISIAHNALLAVSLQSFSRPLYHFKLDKDLTSLFIVRAIILWSSHWERTWIIIGLLLLLFLEVIEGSLWRLILQRPVGDS